MRLSPYLYSRFLDVLIALGLLYASSYEHVVRNENVFYTKKYEQIWLMLIDL